MTFIKIAWARRILAGLFFSSISVAAFAESPGHAEPPAAGPPQTLEALVQEVLDRNPELQACEALVAQARGDRRTAGQWANPNLTVQGGFREVEGAEGDPAQGYSLELSLTQTFEFPGKASLRKAIADRDIERARWGLEQFRLSLSGKVRQLAWRYQAASHHAHLATRIQTGSDELIRLLSQRKLAGAKPLLEIRVIQARQIELGEIRKQEILERDDALHELNQLRHRRPETPLALADHLDGPPHLEPLTLDQLISTVHRHNLSLKTREAEIERARLSLDAARLAAAPDFSFGPFFSRDTGGERETTVGASLSFDLPLWNQNQGAMDSARSLEALAMARWLQAQNEAERAAHRLWSVYQATRDQLSRLDKSLIDHFEASTDLADRQYRQGAIDVDLYLENQHAALRTLKIYDEALLQCWNAALDIELLTAGKIPLVENHPKKAAPHEK